MANEWVPIQLYGPNGDGGKIRFTIADGASVSIGALLQLLDPVTVSYSHLAKVAIAGVAAEEHIANKGITEISVWTDGDFLTGASGAVLLGYPVLASLQDNKVQAVSAEDLASGGLVLAAMFGAKNIGWAKEHASGADTFTVRLSL